MIKKLEWQKTKFPGVFFIVGKNKITGRAEKIFYVKYYDQNGTRHMEKAGRESRGMSASKANQLRVLRMTGKAPSNVARRQAEKDRQQAELGRMTLSRLWDQYKAQKQDSKSIRTDRSRFEKHIKPILGDMEPRNIDALSIDRLRLKLLKTLTPQTVQHVLELIRRLVNFGVKKHLCEPLKFKIEMPRVDNLKTETLTNEQLAKLLTTIDENPQYEVAGQMMKMALYTGMRRGEIFRLQWQDIDFERGFITIRESKGGKDTAIPLNGPARTLLNGMDRSEKSLFVFPGKDNAEHRKEAKRGLNEIKKIAKLPDDFRPMHGLRHHFASALVSDGVDLYTVGRLLTHKSPNMTRRYAHLSDAALRRASERAGKLASSSVNLDNVANIKTGEPET